MRLFVAVEPSSDVRHAAALRANELRGALERHGISRELRWVPQDNLHLTIWFLGEVSEPRSVHVVEALRPALHIAPFELEIGGFGAFPPSGSPRVVWLGVTAGVRELASAHAEVGSRLEPWGFAPEGRAYSAHLTIARIKAPLAARARALLRDALQATPAEAGACRIESLTLYRSRTSPKGALYESLLRVPLS